MNMISDEFKVAAVCLAKVYMRILIYKERREGKDFACILETTDYNMWFWNLNFQTHVLMWCQLDMEPWDYVWIIIYVTLASKMSCVSLGFSLLGVLQNWKFQYLAKNNKDNPCDPIR